MEKHQYVGHNDDDEEVAGGAMMMMVTTTMMSFLVPLIITIIVMALPLLWWIMTMIMDIASSSWTRMKKKMGGIGGPSWAWAWAWPGTRAEMRMETCLPPGRLGLRLLEDETLSFLRPHGATSIAPFSASRRARHGPVFKAQLFGHPTVVSMDPGLNKWVLQHEGRLFRSSYPESVRRILGPWSMLAIDGDEHRHMRSFALAFASHPDKLRNPTFLRTLHSLVIDTLSAWGHDSPVSGPDHFVVHAHWTSREFTFNFMVQQILSLQPGEPDNLFFLQHYQNFMKGLVSLPINFPGTAYHKAFKSKEKIMKKLNEIMTKRRTRRSEHEMTLTPSSIHHQYGHEDHMGHDLDFLEHIMREGSLSEDQVLDLVMNMLFAGHETSSVALTLAIGFLAQSPMALTKLRDEHIRIQSNNKTQGILENGTRKDSLDVHMFINAWDDYKSMDYTQCVIKETLRLGNVVRFVHREAMQDITFGGYRIPKGWQVLPMFEAPHLDEELYENPQQFLPERWQRTNQKVAPYFTPFGGGIRMCAGIEFAKLEIAVFLHHLVLNFDWSLAEPHVDIGLAFPYVDFPNGLPIKVKRLMKTNDIN